ncbi:hypothetical protein AHF37_03744 [Paragonimus kellicotti]|nr:hypothetical protein AHF37_03744 [Paragonimus kellicotti]
MTSVPYHHFFTYSFVQYQGFDVYCISIPSVPNRSFLHLFEVSHSV